MSSNLCSCAVASTTIAGTLTGGIQDIAALLPLLGTEQCEEHVSSALTKGYLYAAASPMSLFGSLGLARAGLKTFLASCSIPAWNTVGARTLSNMGFKSQGMNLSLIMIDPNDKDGRYLVETRLEKLVEELHIDKTKIQNVRHRTVGWNLTMMFLSAILCSFGVLPYIFLTVKIGSTLPHETRWTFPAIRVIGGFLTTTMMQFIIQRRIAALSRRWILEQGSNKTRFDQGRKSASQDVEKNTRIIIPDSNTPLTWFLLVLLLLGVLASVVGYIGCFSVVQSATRSTGPLVWLCSEACLSLLRMFLWGLNPAFHDAPPLELVLARDRYPPLPTCKLYDHDIKTERILPLTRANQFLNSITSFTGVVERFDHPDVTLYYTLTRKAVPHADSNNFPLHEPGDHVLYITIFDHKERANTRVYTQSSGIEYFYATESSLPIIDPKQGLLEVKLGDEIDNQDDPITSNHDVRSKLNTHYRSIMDQIHFVARQSIWDPTYRIENKWTMAMVHTKSTPRSGMTTETHPDAGTLSLRDFAYLQNGQLEKICQSLCSARGEWIATYVHWVIQEMKGRFTSQDSTRMTIDVDESQTTKGKAEGKRRMSAEETESWESSLQVGSNHDTKSEDIGNQVIDAIRRMELSLVNEMEIWEEHLRDQAKKFIRKDDVMEKARFTKEWEMGFRTRLDADIRAMEARVDASELEVKESRSDSDELIVKWKSMHDDIRNARQALAQRFAEVRAPFRSPTNLSSRKYLRIINEYQTIGRNIEIIVGQPTGAQRERLEQQLEIASQSSMALQDAIFWMNDSHGLTEFKISRSKWLSAHMLRFYSGPLYTRALQAMDDAIFVVFNHVNSDHDYALVTDLIRNLPSLTSIHISDAHQLPAIKRDTPLFINDRDGSNEIETFLNDNQSQLALTRRTLVFIDTGRFVTSTDPGRLGLSLGSKIAVSFYGPPYGSLILKLTHSSDDGAVILILRESHSSRTFEYPVPFSPTTININLFPGSSDHPSFVPNTRNHVIIEVGQGIWKGYVIRDIRLQDEAGNDYNSASAKG